MSFTPLERHQLKELGCNHESSRSGIEEALGKIRRMAPRCETCRWWGKDRDGRVGDREGKQKDWRQCWRITEPDSLAQGGYDETMTACNFGCIQWEPKERRDG